jgi:hypothetical protein
MIWHTKDDIKKKLCIVLYCIVLYCIVLYRGGLICTLYDVAILEGKKKPIGISLSVKSL